jgi:hypothetical protein
MKTLRGLMRFLWPAVRWLVISGRGRRQTHPAPVATSHAEEAAPAAPPVPKPVPVMPEAVWVDGKRIELPPPSVWPVVLAFGVMLVFFGLITSVVFVAVGVALIARAIAGWIGEIEHEHAE